MRKRVKLWGGFATSWLWAASAFAQPAAPAAPAAAAAAPAAVAGAAEKLGPLEKFCDKLDKCRRKCCEKPSGQLINSMTQPLSAMTGGVIPPFCPPKPRLEDLAKPGVEGAEAQGKKDALEAAARVRAVRYLGTLDCRYYTEAQDALIAALRADRSECVRYEAAVALARGCCCNKPVIDALTISVNGAETDGNPAERCERIREVAYIALQRCLSCYTAPAEEEKKTDEPTAEEAPPPKKADEGEKARMPAADEKKNGEKADDKKDDKKTDDKKDEKKPDDKKTDDKKKTAGQRSIERAKLAVANYQIKRGQQPVAEPTTAAALPTTGTRSVYHILKYAVDGGTPAAPPAQPQQAPAAVAFAVATPQPLPTPLLLTPPPVSITQTPPTPPAIIAPVSLPPTVLTPAPLPVSLVKPAELPLTNVTFRKNDHSANAVPSAPAVNVASLVMTLRQAPVAAERHAALQGLVKANCVTSEVTTVLLEVAYADAVPAVRIDCIRCLACLKAAQPNVLTHLKNLATDADARVSKEASEAINYLSSLPPATPTITLTAGR